MVRHYFKLNDLRYGRDYVWKASQLRNLCFNITKGSAYLEIFINKKEEISAYCQSSR